jgi:hypothetical protein
MTMIVARAEAATTMDHLEQRGFLIDKITVRPAPKHAVNLAVR